MTYKRFEDVPVWQAAIRLAELAEDFLLAADRRITRGKQDQLDRCSLSVSNNIAEGFERGTTKELLAFLYIARGSAGEVRSMMRFFERRLQISDLRSEISDIVSLAESLQNSDIEGPRHLNDQSRAQYVKKKAQEESRKKGAEMERAILEKMPDGHPFKESMRRKGGI